MNREQWLTDGVSRLRELFKIKGFHIPENIKVTCGFPSTNGTARKSRTIGQVWDKTQSSADVYEIFISPTIDNAASVLATLAHELVHVVVGLKAGHGKMFKQCALAIGLEGK